MTHAEIYGRIRAFFAACVRNERSVSDTWVHSIARKGADYALDQMLLMRRPGSDVTLHINIFDHFGDVSRIDLGDPIQRTLVEAGESEFGAPMREISLLGRTFSSVYLKHLAIASRIIARLEARGIHRPVVMEIGGGQGLLMSALRKWYGERMTAIAVDIPETLFYQSFYLAGAHPDAPVVFAPGRDPIRPPPGGFAFVNAFAADAHEFDVDVLVNANSMQEMDADVANAYLRLADRWIRPGGLLEFRNSYGHAIDSVPNPSDYEFGDEFRLVDSDFGDFFTDNSATPFVAFSFERDSRLSHSAAARRLALRVLWNGYGAGYLAPGATATRAVEAAAAASDESAAAAAIDAAGLGEWAHGLRAAPIISPAAARKRGPVEGDLRWRRLTTLWNLQKHVAHAMRADAPPLAGEPFAAAGVAAGSDHWSAHFACMAAVLGDRASALASIDGRATDALPVWRVRFAWIARRAGAADVAERFIASVGAETLDPAWRPALAVGLHACGRSTEAAALLDSLVDDAQETESLFVLHRCYARIGRLESLARVEARLAAVAPARFAARRAEMAATLLAICPEARATVDLRIAGGASTPAAIELLHRLGETAEARRRARAAARSGWDSYYALGGLIGPLLLVEDGDGIARECMDRSLALRRGAIRHLEFLAGRCLAYGRFPAAVEYLERIVAIKPYDHVAQGQHAYAALSAEARSRGTYGTPEDLPALFQTYQGFYFPEGPRVR
jgi:tetratricopeptide (TPR) repeat protein